MSKHITIIGAGLAGALQAVLLAKRGYQVELFEKRGDMRKQEMSAGRSINLALAERGLEGLRRAGLADEVLAYCVAMPGRMVHDIHGAQNFQPYSIRPDEHINSVHRGLLNISLLNAAEKAGVKIHFDHELIDVDFADKTATFRIAGPPNQEDLPLATYAIGPLIGADGAGSQLREMLCALDEFDIRSQSLGHGYKELHIPPTASGEAALEINALHIWPRGNYMLIALPNSDKSFTVTLFLANQGTPSFEKLDTASDSELAEFFNTQFPDACALFQPDAVAQFRANPTGFLGTIYAERWAHHGDALLIGDAAHAIVPFHGQGMNCAFEDCVVLDELLAGFPSDFAAVFSQFEQQRRPNAEAIATMALENYIEMRDSVADRRYLLKKQLERELETRFPERYLSRYAMVMFSQIPYAIAQQRGEIQSHILNQLSEGKTTMGEVNWELAERLVEAELSLLSQ